MRENESGNVFFYIFLAIALLAALSFAVSQSGRTSGAQLTQDRRNLLASEIIGYADTVGKSVTQLRLRGTPVTHISFANPFVSSGEYDCLEPTDKCPIGKGPEDDIFNPAGGAVVYQDPPSNATTTGTEEWQFLASNEIENVGTTEGDANSTDLLMVIENVIADVCTEINDLLDVPNPPPADTELDKSAKFKPDKDTDPFTYAKTVGDEDSNLAGKTEACFQENSAQYIYYKVLYSR